MYRFMAFIIISIFFSISVNAAALQTKHTSIKSDSYSSYNPIFPSFSSIFRQKAAHINYERLDDLVRIKNPNHGLKTFCFYRNPFDKVPLEIGLITSLKPLNLYDKLILQSHFGKIKQLAISKTLPFTKVKPTIIQELF